MKHSGKTHAQQVMNLKSVPILLMDLSIFGCRKNTFLYCTDEVRAFRGRKERNSCINLTVLVLYCCKRKRWGNAGQGWGHHPWFGHSSTPSLPQALSRGCTAVFFKGVFKACYILPRDEVNGLWMLRDICFMPHLVGSSGLFWRQGLCICF